MGEQELQVKNRARTARGASNNINSQPLDVDVQRQQTRRSQEWNDARMGSTPGAEAVSGGISQPEPVQNTMLQAVVAMDPQEEVEAAREEERKLAAEREEVLRRRLEELERGNNENANVVVARATTIGNDGDYVDEEGSLKRRIFCAVICSVLGLGILLLVLWGSGVAFNTESNKLETPDVISPVPSQTVQPSSQPTSKPSSHPTSRPSSSPTSCVAEATHCGLNPGSWEDFDELDCDVCCYGFHYFLRMSDRENKAYCKEAPTVWNTPFLGTPNMAYCTFRSRKCGLNPDSWEDFDELDCADCCYGYHSYLDEYNQNKAYCMQDPKANEWRV